MEWLADPTIWVGLLTLVVLEIILGIDNIGERVESHGWSFEISDMDGWRINKVLARRVGADGESSVVDST